MNLIHPGEQLVNMGSATVCLVDEGLLEPREQLGAFLDDRQVGGEVRVEDPVEPEPPQGAATILPVTSVPGG